MLLATHKQKAKDDLCEFYSELASIVNVEGITTGANVGPLCRLRDNDSDLKVLVLCDEHERNLETDRASYYCPSANEDLGWLGHFVGKSTTLSLLRLHELFLHNDSIGSFFEGAGRNSSIRTLRLEGLDLSNDGAIRTMKPLLEDNTNLRTLAVVSCDVGAGGYRRISSMIQECPCLQSIVLVGSSAGGRQTTKNIASLGESSKLKRFYLHQMNIKSTGCVSLSRLSNLCTLSLVDNGIGNDGVAALRGAVENGSSLSQLDLSHNPRITIRGYKSIAAMLKSSQSNLEKLALLWNHVDNKRAKILAGALGNGCKLRLLVLVADDDQYYRQLADNLGIRAEDNTITRGGWRAFSKALCDTTSIDATCNSNHTLLGVTRVPKNVPSFLPRLLRFALTTNRVFGGAKDVLLLRKIEKQHLRRNDAAMRLFLEMDRSILPYFIARVPKDPPKGVQWNGVKWPLQLLYWCVRNLPSQFGRGILLDGSAAKWLDPIRELDRHFSLQLLTPLYLRPILSPLGPPLWEIKTRRGPLLVSKPPCPANLLLIPST